METNSQPDDLTVSHQVARAQVLIDDFEHHVGAELANALAANARKVLSHAMRQGIFQGFIEHWREAFA